MLRFLIGDNPKAPTTTALFIKGSPTCWICKGINLLLKKEQGTKFKAFLAEENGRRTLTVEVKHHNGIDCWKMVFAAPAGHLLVKDFPVAFGRLHATQGDAIIEMVATEGRTNPDVSGEFVIHELDANDGKVVRLAVDFVVYDDNDLDAWNAGSLRINSPMQIQDLTPALSPTPVI